MVNEYIYGATLVCFLMGVSFITQGLKDIIYGVLIKNLRTNGIFGVFVGIVCLFVVAVIITRYIIPTLQGPTIGALILPGAIM